MKAEIFSTNTKNEEPIIEITSEAWYKILYIVEKAPEEIGWLGSVIKLEDKKCSNHYLITDIWLMEQQTNAATCSLLGEARDKLIRKIISEAATTDEGIEKANQLRFWGHSHVNMSVGASSQDNETIREMDSCPWYIRGIFNKKGDTNIELYCFDENILWTDLELKVRGLSEEQKSELDEQIKSLCTREPIASYYDKWYNTSYYGNYANKVDNSAQTAFPYYYNYVTENGSNKKDTEFEDADEDVQYEVTPKELNDILSNIIYRADGSIMAIIPVDNAFDKECVVYKDIDDLKSHLIVYGPDDDEEEDASYVKSIDVEESSCDENDEISVEKCENNEDNSKPRFEVNNIEGGQICLRPFKNTSTIKQNVQKYNLKTKKWEW